MACYQHFTSFFVYFLQEDAAEFFIKYAKAEEQFGLARHAVAIYDRAARAVPPSRRLDMYRLYAKKVTSAEIT